MKKFTINKTYLMAMSSIFMMFSCSADEADTLELELESTSEQLKTSGANTCSSNVNFQDLVVETSWITGKTGDRKTFDACVVDGEAWMDRISNGRYTMKCLKGDSHRTELKEDSGDESALDKYKSMKITANFTNIPKHGVTIAQIHNRHSSIKRPFVRLYIDNDSYIKIKETETTPNGSKSTYSTYTGLKYTEGADVHIVIETGLNDQSKAQFKIYTGKESWKKEVWPSSSWNSYSNDYYLKAGVYSEGDDKEATATYRYFSIVH